MEQAIQKQLEPIKPAIRPPRKTHGGKFYLRNEIIAALRPDHSVYVEPFGGGASIALNKPVVDVEVYNDVDVVNANLFGSLKYFGEYVRDGLKNHPYSEATFKAAQNRLSNWVKQQETRSPSMIDNTHYYRAIDAIIVSRMSRGGTGRSFAWSERLRGGQPGDLNSWQTFNETDLPRAIKRVAGWSVHCENAIATIVRYMFNPRAMIYLDPPYFPQTRTARKVYRCEMTAGDHADLLSVVTSADVKASIAISGYDNDFYREVLETRNKWRRALSVDMANHSGQNEKKQRRTEILWTNY